MSDFDLIIRGASVVLPHGVDKLDLGLKDGVIAAMGTAVFGSTDADLDASDFSTSCRAWSIRTCTSTNPAARTGKASSTAAARWPPAG